MRPSAHDADRRFVEWYPVALSDGSNVGGNVENPKRVELRKRRCEPDHHAMDREDEFEARAASLARQRGALYTRGDDTQWRLYHRSVFLLNDQSIVSGELTSFECKVTCAGSDTHGCYIGVACADYDGVESPRTSNKVYALHSLDQEGWNSVRYARIPVPEAPAHHFFSRRRR